MAARLHTVGAVKLVVATLLLAAAAVTAKVAVEHLAPERVASASTQPTDRWAAAGDAIRSIRFDAPGLRAAALSDVIETRLGGPIDRARLDADRVRLRDWLVARGHLDAAVEAPATRLTDSGTFIDFVIDAGPVFVVRDVRFEGKRAGVAGLASVPTVIAGHDVAAERLDRNVELLRDWFAHRGTQARVSVRLDVDRFSKQADVVFRVD